jgi:hypothetical protein
MNRLRTYIYERQRRKREREREREEFYSAIRKNEIMWFEGKWMQLEDTMLSEVSQAQKDSPHVFSHMWETDTIQMQTIL